jgi:hypothetical protein
MHPGDRVPGVLARPPLYVEYSTPGPGRIQLGDERICQVGHDGWKAFLSGKSGELVTPGHVRCKALSTLIE